jgi:hypothetical protein
MRDRERERQRAVRRDRDRDSGPRTSSSSYSNGNSNGSAVNNSSSSSNPRWNMAPPYFSSSRGNGSAAGISNNAAAAAAAAAAATASHVQSLHAMDDRWSPGASLNGHGAADTSSAGGGSFRRQRDGCSSCGGMSVGSLCEEPLDAVELAAERNSSSSRRRADRGGSSRFRQQPRSRSPDTWEHDKWVSAAVYRCSYVVMVLLHIGMYLRMHCAYSCARVQLVQYIRRSAHTVSMLPDCVLQVVTIKLLHCTASAASAGVQSECK